MGLGGPCVESRQIDEPLSKQNLGTGFGIGTNISGYCKHII